MDAIYKGLKGFYPLTITTKICAQERLRKTFFKLIQAFCHYHTNKQIILFVPQLEDIARSSLLLKQGLNG